VLTLARQRPRHLRAGRFFAGQNHGSGPFWCLPPMRGAAGMNTHRGQTPYQQAARA
jgi:hypothetical protein